MTEVKSLYIHIPFCISKCKYCDFFSVPVGKNPIPDLYINSLCNEIVYRLRKYNIIELETLYIGGGTPSLLKFNQLSQIFETLKTHTVFSPDCEITIEVNPDDLTVDLLNCWKQLGINRISLGIQTFNKSALAYVSRRATAEINKEALKLLKTFWPGDLSVDLICGLPNQSAESFISDLSYLVNLTPAHISMYSLTIEDGTPLGKEFNEGKLNYDFDLADNLWLRSRQFLEDNGYVHYEVSNFCLPGKKCRHNLKYWNHENYLGCGCGGTGSYYNNKGEGLRWTNIKNIKDYCNYWNFECDSQNIPEETETIDIKTSEFEFFMMGLRKLEGVYDSQFEKIFNYKIPNKVIEAFYRWKKDNLCEITVTSNGTNYTLGKKGILFLNKFLEEII